MAAKTKVEGNRVTIDDSVYDLKPAGAGRYGVFDEFGGHLGYLKVEGRRVIADDWGVAGAHPLAVIARLWGATLLSSTAPPAVLTTRGVCRVSTHEAPTDAALAEARLHRGWQRAQPGVKASYLVRDPATGKAMTITICQNAAALAALDAAAGAAGAPLPTTGVELFPFVEDP
jgi:hypothetical protein